MSIGNQTPPSSIARYRALGYSLLAPRHFQSPGSFILIANQVDQPMTRRRKIYEGKAKILYEGPEPGTLIQYFKDDATAFNAQKKGTIAGKGVINNRVSEHVFTRLSTIGIPTHFIRRLNMREQLIRQVEIVPIEVIVRNVAAGTLSKRLGLEEGTPLPHTLLEYCLLWLGKPGRDARHQLHGDPHQ
jgi:SAICAR synthetase